MVEIKFSLTASTDPKKVAEVLALAAALSGAEVHTLQVDESLQSSEETAKKCKEIKITNVNDVIDGPEEKAPAKRKRRTQKEIEAEKQAELNKQIAEENEADEDEDEEDEDTSGLFDFTDADADDDDEDEEEEDEAPKTLDTKDPKHMTVIADLANELMTANKKNRTKISDILTKKLKKNDFKKLTDKEKKIFYSELLKLKN